MKDSRRKSIFPKPIDTNEKVEKRRTTLYIQERRTTALLQDFEQEEKRWVSENEINQKKLFDVQIKIPDDVFWWEPPSVCRWEPWEESDSFKKLSPAMQNYNLNHEKALEERQRQLFAAPPIKHDFKTIKKLQDIKLSEVKKTLPSHYLITEYLLPRMIDDYKFAEEIRDDAEKETKEKENRLKLRKEAIERERKRLAEEAEREKNERGSKTVPRESRLISFVEPEVVPQFVQAETQTDFPFSTELRQSITRKLSKSSKSDGLISSTKLSTDANISKDSTIEQNQNCNIVSENSSKPSASAASKSSNDIAVLTEPLSISSSRRSSRTNLLRSSMAFKRGSRALNTIRRDRKSSSSVSLKGQADDLTEDKSTDELYQSSLIIQARSSFIPSFVQVTPQNQPPRFLFSKRKHLKPLEVIKGLEENESLQSIQLKEILPTIDDGFNEDNTTLSAFLSYLEDLQEKEKPFFHSDSYIERILNELEAKKAENMAEAAAKKLKELKQQFRISKLLEARQRESTFYRVPRKNIAEVPKSRVWRDTKEGHKKRPKSRHQRNSPDSIKE